MKLTDEEKALLDGSEGLACQKAMDLLVKYGDALGAERLIETNNVCVSMSAGAYTSPKPGAKISDIDAALSRMYLDSDEPFEIPRAKVYTCRLIREMDPENWQIQGISPERHEMGRPLGKSLRPYRYAAHAQLYPLPSRQCPRHGRALRLDRIFRRHLLQFRAGRPHQHRGDGERHGLHADGQNALLGLPPR